MRSKKRYTEKYVGITPVEEAEFEDRHQKIFEVFSKNQFFRILDVGCGDGTFSVLLGKACGAKEVYGIEISEKGLESALKNGIKAFQLDIDEKDFPFENDYFDAIFAGEILEHLFDPDHFLGEVFRVLKQKGIFVLSTPNLASIHNRIALLFGFQPFPLGVSAKINIGRLYEPNSVQSLDHVRVLTLRSLKKLLKIHNFEIINVKGSSAVLPKKMRFKEVVNVLDKVFTLLPGLSYRVILVAKRCPKDF